MTNIVKSNSSEVVELKEKYLQLISEGYSEYKALQELNFPRGLYLMLMSEDGKFNEQVSEVRKLRADYWVAKIVEDVDVVPNKDEVAGERLRFDKLQFLAKADNPEKYGNNNKKVDINIDMTKFKLLQPEEAIKALAADPFAIEVDFKELSDEELL